MQPVYNYTCRLSIESWNLKPNDLKNVYNLCFSKVRALEAEIEKWRLDYVSLIQSSIRFSGCDTMDDAELVLFGGDRVWAVFFSIKFFMYSNDYNWFNIFSTVFLILSSLYDPNLDFSFISVIKVIRKFLLLKLYEKFP